MTPDAPHCPWSEQTVLLALHALDPADERAARRHLHSCGVCPAVLDDAEEALAAIGVTAAEPPPPRLRARVLAAIDAPTDRVLAAVPAPPDAGRRRPRRWGSAVAAAAVLAGLVAGGIVVGRLDQQRDAATVHASPPGAVPAVVTSVPHAVLAGRDGHAVAAVALTAVPRFYDLGLPAAAPGRAWVLWGMRGAAATALSAVGPDGTAAVPSAPGRFEAYVLTDEPAGPLPARPGAPVASGEVVPAGS